MAEIIKFPGVTQTAEDRSEEITSELITNMVTTLDNHGVEIENNELQLQMVGVVRLVKAMVDSQLGIENKFNKNLKELAKRIEQTI